MDASQNCIRIFDQAAERYQEKYMDQSLYQEALDFFCEQFQIASPSILDLACGPGNVAQYLGKRIPGIKMQGIDLAPNMVQLAKKNNPKGRFWVMDCQKISGLNEKYDGIICSFLLPYLDKEAVFQLFEDVVSLLKNEGVLYLSTMECQPARSKWQGNPPREKQIFTHYHDGKYLREALEEWGMKILFEKRQTFPGVDISEYQDLLMVAVKSKA